MSLAVCYGVLNFIRQYLVLILGVYKCHMSFT
jgi:hypothetical protein